MPSGIRVAVGVVGALVYAGGGGYLGAINAGWINPDGESNPVLGVLGVGAALVVLAFAGSAFGKRVGETGGLGRAAQILLCLGPALYILSWLIDFAIFGTLSLAFGLICLAIAVNAPRLGGSVDRVLIRVSAVLSLVWNTETISAFLLVGVGLAWAVLSMRLLSGENSARERGPVPAIP